MKIETSNWVFYILLCENIHDKVYTRIQTYNPRNEPVLPPPSPGNCLIFFELLPLDEWIKIQYQFLKI